MSPWLFVSLVTWLCFPRVSGDEPLLEALNQFAKQFSPRERG